MRYYLRRAAAMMLVVTMTLFVVFGSVANPAFSESNDHFVVEQVVSYSQDIDGQVYVNFLWTVNFPNPGIYENLVFAVDFSQADWYSAAGSTDPRVTGQYDPASGIATYNVSGVYTSADSGVVFEGFIKLASGLESRNGECQTLTTLSADYNDGITVIPVSIDFNSFIIDISVSTKVRLDIGIVDTELIGGNYVITYGVTLNTNNQNNFSEVVIPSQAIDWSFPAGTSVDGGIATIGYSSYYEFTITYPGSIPPDEVVTIYISLVSNTGTANGISKSTYVFFHFPNGYGVVKGIAWADNETMNDIRDSGDDLLSGVNVELISLDDASFNKTDVTGTDGKYEILTQPGTYYLRFSKDSAVLVEKDVGGDDSIDSDADPLTGETDPFVVKTYENNEYPIVIINAGSTSTTTADKKLTIQVEQNPADQNVNYLDAGFIVLSPILGTVFMDYNENGMVDTGEVGIPGVTLELYLGGLLAGQAVSDSSGEYRFDDLLPGIYIVKALDTALTAGDMYKVSENETPENLDSLITVVKDSIEPDANVNFGYREMAYVEGNVFMDYNRNNSVDAGENGITQVPVRLIGGAIDLVAYTAPDGSYSFGPVPAGSYEITLLDGVWDGEIYEVSEFDGNLNETVSVLLSDGTTTANINFGYEKYGSISGYIFNDIDEDALVDAGEAGYQSAVVSLNGSETLTDANGYYEFRNLQEGEYTITVVSIPEPLAYQVSEIDGTLDETILVLLGDTGISIEDRNFGYREYAAISGNVFIDFDEDAVMDAGESGIAGGVVSITDGINTDSFTVGTDGHYEFTYLVPGTYVVTLNDSSFASLFYQVSESDGTLNKMIEIEVSDSEVSENNNFGYRGYTLISGYVFKDVNEDNVLDAGETGYQGIEVTITGGQMTYNLTTDANGYFELKDVPVGTYIVVVNSDPLSTYAYQVSEVDGTLDESVMVVSHDSESIINQNFGYREYISISGYVFMDYDEDNAVGAGETGIFGASLEIRGDATVSVVTDASGYFEALGLKPGSYEVVLLHDTWEANLYEVSEKDTTLDMNIAVNGVDGEEYTENNFGYREYAKVSGYVFLDLDEDGVKDALETGIEGVSVDVGGYTVLTNADGFYEVSAIIPGTYSVTPADGAWSYGKYEVSEYDGTLDMDISVTASDGDVLSERNFGFREYIEISGYVFMDYDEDNAVGLSEEGIEEVKVNLGELVAFTDSEGYYSFTDLIPGLYVVTLDITTIPEGLYEVSEVDGTLDYAVSVETFDGEYYADNNFGLRGYGAVSGRLFNDIDEDNISDVGEEGYFNILVRLIGNDTTLETYTNPSGFYFFENIIPSEYRIETDIGRDDLHMVSEADGVLDESIDVSISDMDDITGMNFGYRGYALINGFAFFDVDEDGVFDADESPYPGVTVTLGELSAITDANGLYSFENLVAGEYVLSIAGETDVVFRVSEYDLVPDGMVDADLYELQEMTNVNFGYRTYAEVSGNVFEDINADNLINNGDFGYEDVVVYLMSGDDVAFMTLTDSSGAYGFDHIYPGEYTILVDGASIPTGKVQVSEYDGVLDLEVGMKLLDGEVITEVNFGFFMMEYPKLISGYVYRELDHEYTRGPDEYGYPDITVYLDTGDELFLTVTDSEGYYEFTNLPSGTYTVYIDETGLPELAFEVYEYDNTADNNIVLVIDIYEEGVGYTEVNFGYDEFEEDIPLDIPDTGESGKALYIFAGILLIGIGSILLKKNRRTRA